MAHLRGHRQKLYGIPTIFPLADIPGKEYKFICPRIELRAGQAGTLLIGPS
jgi:hypothetical protein